jgi:hypothetical protein
VIAATAVTNAFFMLIPPLIWKDDAPDKVARPFADVAYAVGDIQLE